MELRDKVEFISPQEIMLLELVTGFEEDSLCYEREGLIYDKTQGYVMARTESYINDGRKRLAVIPKTSDAADEIPHLNLQLTSWSDLSAQEFSPIEWRINKLLPMQGLVIIASPSGEKKSWLALEIVKTLSMGGHFLSNENFPVITSKVLYIDAEMGPKQLQRRGKLVGLDKVPIKNMPLIVTNQELNLRAEGAIEQFMLMIIENGIEVVILDTLRAVAGGLEEDNMVEVRKFLQPFHKIKNLGILIIFLDHTRKPERGGTNIPKKEQIIGSIDKVASADCVLMLKGDVSKAYFTVYQVKNREGVEMNPFNVGIRDIINPKTGHHESVEMNYEGEIDERVLKIDEAKLAIPTIVGYDFVKTQPILSTLAKDYQIQERNAREALRQMVDSGVLEKTKISKSDAYKLSSAKLLDSHQDETGKTNVSI